MASRLLKSLLHLSSKTPRWVTSQRIPGLPHYSSYRCESNQANVDDISTKTVTPADREVRGFSKDNPVIVASPTRKCIVGCCCSEEEPGLKWFYLEEGPTQTCDCGFYFCMERTAEGQWVPEYSQVMQVDENRRDPRLGISRFPFTKPRVGDVYVDPPKKKKSL